MTSEAFRRIERGLQKALAFARGEGEGVVQIEVPRPDVRAIRARTGLSQAEIARSIGVKKATLSNREQGRRTPDGPARVPLALIEREPGIVQRVLS